MARPTVQTPQIIDEVLARLAKGEYLIAIARDAHMPDISTLNRWRDRDGSLCDKIARARARGVEYRVEQAGEIADDSSNDYVTKTDANGREYEAVNSEHIQRSRLRVDTRYREAEALAPKVYGKRSVVEHQGGIHITTQSTEELEAEIMHMIATGRFKLPAGVEIEEYDPEEETEDDDDFTDIA